MVFYNVPGKRFLCPGDDHRGGSTPVVHFTEVGVKPLLPRLRFSSFLSARLDNRRCQQSGAVATERRLDRGFLLYL